MQSERIILVTGHSMGGAVANLLADHLTICTSASCCPVRGSARVYAYTFAAPNVKFLFTPTAHQNIFNILNSNDLVTTVPGLWTGLWGRYGRSTSINMVANQDVPYAPNRLMPTYLDELYKRDDTFTWPDMVALP